MENYVFIHKSKTIHNKEVRKRLGNLFKVKPNIITLLLVHHVYPNTHLHLGYPTCQFLAVVHG